MASLPGINPKGKRRNLVPLSAPHRVKLAAALFAACLFALCPAARAQQQSIKLDKIEFKGLERVKEEEALGKSGLTAGQTVSIDDVEAAANRDRKSVEMGKGVDV